MLTSKGAGSRALDFKACAFVSGYLTVTTETGRT